MLVAMQGFSLSDVGHFIVKVATAPITVPLVVSKDILVGGIGVFKGVVNTGKEAVAALKPPPPPPPPVQDAFGVGGAGGASLSATSSIGSTSMLPFVIGGVALLGLVTVAVLVRKKKGGRRR